MTWLGTIPRVLATLAILALAGFAGYQLWYYYMEAPWTRDGQVRADVVQVAPDVSGLVTDIRIRDNQQVKAGDVLFVIDQSRYHLAVRQAQAAVASDEADAAQKRRDAKRYQELTTDAVTQIQREQAQTTADIADATLQRARANLDTAQLNLTRTEVMASVNGLITNFTMRPGDYVSAGKPVFALLDTDSFRVEGYFEETKLPRIHVGDPVRIHLMGVAPPLHGHVEGIASGIVNRQLGSSPDLLANVSPTFSWVRLAQRIPVRVHLDHVPDGVRLVAGRTATVSVEAKAVGENGTSSPVASGAP